ncbi:acyl carrier protein [Streptomyces sp. NPDC059002]|uniref:acyl carrier protein n=1 Tax=Streptomyces sp. NPDC059002 TaxID=3346690 RepID=UPI0036901A62
MRPISAEHSVESITAWLTERFAGYARRSVDEIDPQRPFADYGLDSVGAMSLAVDIEDHFGVEIDAEEMWNHPTPAALGELLTGKLAGA